MNTSKLKAISIASFCFVASLWSETQGMDNRPDILEPSTANAIVGMQLSARYESDVGPIMSDSISPDLEKLKHTHSSWASYLLSPAKFVIHTTSDVITYANAHPVYCAFIMGMILAGESTMVSAVGIPAGDCVYSCLAEAGRGWKDVVLNPILVGAWRLANCVVSCADNQV